MASDVRTDYLFVKLWFEVYLTTSGGSVEYCCFLMKLYLLRTPAKQSKGNWARSHSFTASHFLSLQPSFQRSASHAVSVCTALYQRWFCLNFWEWPAWLKFCPAVLALTMAHAVPLSIRTSAHCWCTLPLLLHDTLQRSHAQECLKDRRYKANTLSWRRRLKFVRSAPLSLNGTTKQDTLLKVTEMRCKKYNGETTSVYDCWPKVDLVDCNENKLSNSFSFPSLSVRQHHRFKR